MIIKKAVCMHEEDYGTLWKHTEYRTGHSEVRRSRRLVLSFISTIANYEYGFYWYFYQVTPCCQQPCLALACCSSPAMRFEDLRTCAPNLVAPGDMHCTMCFWIDDSMCS